jgi:hypothetical protein
MTASLEAAWGSSPSESFLAHGGTGGHAPKFEVDSDVFLGVGSS